MRNERRDDFGVAIKSNASFQMGLRVFF